MVGRKRGTGRDQAAQLATSPAQGALPAGAHRLKRAPWTARAALSSAGWCVGLAAGERVRGGWLCRRTPWRDGRAEGRLPALPRGASPLLRFAQGQINVASFPASLQELQAIRERRFLSRPEIEREDLQKWHRR